MKQIFNGFFIYLAFQFLYNSVTAQITINGHNPRRYRYSAAGNAVSISYGSIFWVDGNNSHLPGYSSSRSSFHDASDFFSIEKMNVSTGVTLGYERTLSHKFSLRAAFSTSKLTTGFKSRFDLIGTDKSRISQVGLYSKYTLTKNEDRRLQIQWLVGPELVYVKKDVLVEDYMVDESSTPGNYRQNISIVEGAILTGLGISFKLSNSFSLFSDSMIGISLPGKGFKSTNSGLGLKYNW